MAADPKELYKKVAGLRDLKSAIKEIKKANTEVQPEKVIEKAEPKKEEKPKPDHNLKYLGRKKLVDGILSHMIGSDEPDSHHYQMDVNMDKHAKGLPCVMLSAISHKGEILDHSADYHKDMKDAIKSIVHHKMKKAWK